MILKSGFYTLLLDGPGEEGREQIEDIVATLSFGLTGSKWQSRNKRGVGGVLESKRLIPRAKSYR
jgi:hypothetical protein